MKINESKFPMTAAFLRNIHREPIRTRIDGIASLIAGPVRGTAQPRAVRTARIAIRSVVGL